MLAESKERATKGKSKGIVSWPADERPRERLLSRGPHALTEAELLGILLRIGANGKSAIELARQLLKQFGSLQAMMSAPLDAWQGIKGLGAAKIAQLQAAFEVGRRTALPAKREETYVKSTAQAAAYFTARLRVNPSSGNLHPTEGYVLIGGIAELGEAPGLFHYAPAELEAK